MHCLFPPVSLIRLSSIMVILGLLMTGQLQMEICGEYLFGGWGLFLLHEEFFHSTIFSEGHQVTWLLFLWPLVTSEIYTRFCTQACKICSLFDMGGECYCCPQTSPAPSQLTAGSEDHLWGHPEIFTCCNGRDQTRLYYFLFNYGNGHVEKLKGYMIIYYRNMLLFLSTNHNCDVFLQSFSS